jgi:hypothetical protein
MSSGPFRSSRLEPISPASLVPDRLAIIEAPWRCTNPGRCT